MTAPDPRVGEIEARLSAATPGPWFQGREGKRFEDARDVYTEREVSATSRDIGRIDYPEDAALIANAPADVAYLLAELRKAHEALARVEGLHAPMAIYELDENGHVNSDDESKYVRSICGTCSDTSVTESLDDGNYDISGEWGEVGWPCPTAAAVAAANGDGNG